MRYAGLEDMPCALHLPFLDDKRELRKLAATLHQIAAHPTLGWGQNILAMLYEDYPLSPVTAEFLSTHPARFRADAWSGRYVRLVHTLNHLAYDANRAALRQWCRASERDILTYLDHGGRVRGPQGLPFTA